MSKKIVVIGSSNVDFIMKMDHLPARGETVTNATFMQTFGGKGANQAVGAAFALPVGAISEPVRTDDGVFVIRVDKKVSPGSQIPLSHTGSVPTQPESLAIRYHSAPATRRWATWWL